VHTKVNLFNPYILTASMLLGILSSVLIGMANWNQSKPNYDDLTRIKAVKSQLKTPIANLENIQPIANNLSAYNKKVANSKMLETIDKQILSNISDEYLKSIKDNSKETSAKFFAVRQYGLIISVVIVIISLFITAPTIWLVISAVCAFIDARFNGGRA
jgi:hypothetical protein